MANLRPDWRSYFLGFCERHGGDPVEIDGRLVFRDGWAYARADYRGPEYPPPKHLDDLVRLQLTYWRRRREVLKKKRDRLIASMEALASAQLGRDVPIPVLGTTQVEDREGRLITVPASLDVRWDDLKLELSLIANEVDEAGREMLLLEGIVVDEPSEV